MTLLSIDPTSPQRRELPGGAFIEYEASFLTARAADQMFEALTTQLAWEQRHIVLFGRRVMQPRLIGWGGSVPYRYSGQTLPPRALPQCVHDLFARVKAHTGIPFNHVLFNRYRGAEDAMGMHSDDERELGANPVLASLSLGATRRFVIAPRSRSESARKFALELAHGSLLTMGGRFQHAYRHGIPRQRAPIGERINLTFRHLLTIPSP